MASHPGAQRTSRVSRRRGTGGSAAPPETPPGAADEPVAPATAPETGEIYRTLFTELRRAFGGTLDDVNADAIAFAASELYRKDVEPRLWEQKTAHEILDSFGVPRAGAFTRYSLSDRLLLLRLSADPGRADQAHALLTELGAPASGPTGSRLPLKDRLAWLLEGTGPVSAAVPDPDPDPDPDPPSEPGGGDLRDDPPTPDDPPTTDASAEEPPAGEEASGDPPPHEPPAPEVSPAALHLLETLEAARDTATADRAEDGTAAATDGATEAAPAPSPDLPAAELVGLGTVIAGIQEELIRLRQAVEAVERRVDEVLLLLHDGAAAPPPVAAPVAASPPDAPVEAVPPPAAATPDDLTRVVPVAPGIPLDEVPPGPPRRRRRGLKLLIITVVLGLLIAGVAIAISVVGWTELRDRLRIGSVGLAASVVATQARIPNGGTSWTRSTR